MTKLRSLADKIYKSVDEADSYLDAIEDLEEILKSMPINIKEGITNTKVDITNEGIVVERNLSFNAGTELIESMVKA